MHIRVQYKLVYVLMTCYLSVQRKTAAVFLSVLERERKTKLLLSVALINAKAQDLIARLDVLNSLIQMRNMILKFLASRRVKNFSFV